MQKEVSRLRSLIESYEKVPSKYWPIFNYVTVREMDLICREKLIISLGGMGNGHGERVWEAYHRFLKAVDYWIRKKFPDYRQIISWKSDILRYKDRDMPYMTADKSAKIATLMFNVMGLEKYAK